MAFVPKLEDYDIKILTVFGNQTDDFIYRLHIKSLIIKKISDMNYPLFYLISKFSFADKILKESYAEVIVMKMKEREFLLDNETIDEIIGLVSLDTLVCYGLDAKSIIFREKCRDEFSRIAMEIEDKVELERKINLGKRRVYKIKNIKKGDKK